METNIHTEQHTKNMGVFNVLRKQIQMNGCDIAYIYIYPFYEGWNFNSGNYLFTTDTK